MRALAVLLLLVALPLVAAQGHQHAAGGKAVAAVLYDGPPSGRAVVGGFTHFGFALLDEEGRPAAHRDAAFRVEQEGVVLFETPDAHEYDGLFGFDVTFTRPGPYRVVATSEGLETGVFEGTVVPRADETEAAILFEQAPAAGPGDNAIEGVLSIVGPDGAILPHTDAIVEFRHKGTQRLAARTHLHVHEEPMRFTQGFDAPGEYDLRVVGYRAFPNGRSPDVHAVVADFGVTAGALALPAAPAAPAAAPGVLEPIGASAEKDGVALHATYDPQNQVGVGQVARIAALVTNATGPLAHVDFSFTLRGPRGLVFHSESLHEYDGVFEYVFVPGAPGAYDGVVEARLDEGTLLVPVHVQVVPPAVPLMGAGVATVTVEGLDGAAAGAPVDLTFRVAGPSGPVEHSEVDVTIYHDGEAPVHQFKLHTHGSGEMRASVLFPHAGHWKVQVDPLPTLPQAVVFQGPAGRDAPIVFEAEIRPGVPLGEVDRASGDGAARTVPAWGLAGLAGSAFAALALLRRRA